MILAASFRRLSNKSSLVFSCSSNLLFIGFNNIVIPWWRAILEKKFNQRIFLLKNLYTVKTELFPKKCIGWKKSKIISRSYKFLQNRSNPLIRLIYWAFNERKRWSYASLYYSTSLGLSLGILGALKRYWFCKYLEGTYIQVRKYTPMCICFFLGD